MLASESWLLGENYSSIWCFCLTRETQLSTVQLQWLSQWNGHTLQPASDGELASLDGGNTTLLVPIFQTHNRCDYKQLPFYCKSLCCNSLIYSWWCFPQSYKDLTGTWWSITYFVSFYIITVLLLLNLVRFTNTKLVVIVVIKKTKLSWLTMHGSLFQIVAFVLEAFFTELDLEEEEKCHGQVSYYSSTIRIAITLLHVHGKEHMTWRFRKCNNIIDVNYCCRILKKEETGVDMPGM